MRIISNNRGVSLVVLIMVMLGVAIVGGGVATVMSSKHKSYHFASNSFNAYQIANAGAEFAIGYCENESASNCDTHIKNSEFTANFGGGSFKTQYNSVTDTITSTGTYKGVSREVKVVNFSIYASGSKGPKIPKNIGSFPSIESQSGQTIAVNPTQGTISLGQGKQESFGAVWYGGNSTDWDCINGSCNFGKGFRAYFVFQFAKGSTGDGFTFAVINGADNTASSVGGDTGMGELLAYGGDSRKYDTASKYIDSFLDGKGNGIKPPKFAVEFDIYKNTGCPTNPCGPGSRCDPANQQHMAYVFWGDETPIRCQEIQYVKWAPGFYYPVNSVVYVGNPKVFYRTTDGGTSGSNTPPANSGLTWVNSTWIRRTPYSNGSTVVPTNPNGYYYNCSTAGNSGNSEPNWCTGVGCTVSDSGVQWTYAGLTGFPGRSSAYDDNKHTAGSGTDDGNSTTGAGPTNTTSSNSYYTDASNPSTWLADTNNPSTTNPKYAFRMEVIRDPVARTYRIKSWIKTCTDGTENCDMYTIAAFGNVGIDYTADAPTLDRTITLDATYNNKFDRFLFGWTVATGAATQIADVRKFSMNFKP